MAGFLTSATLVADGWRTSLDGWTTPTFEPELAVRIDRDVAAEATVDAVRAAIGAVAPAIELVDLGPIDDLAVVLGGTSSIACTLSGRGRRSPSTARASG